MAYDQNETTILGVSGYSQIPYGNFLKTTDLSGKLSFVSNTPEHSAESNTPKFSASSNTTEFSFET